MARRGLQTFALSVGLGGALWACATQQGDLRSIIQLPSNVAAPAPPPAPGQAAGFPPVTLVWQQADAKQAATSTSRPAGTPSTKPAPVVKAEPKPEPKPEPKVESVAEPKTEPTRVTKPEPEPKPKTEPVKLEPPKETLASLRIEVPALPAKATTAEKDFYGQATRAAERIYLDDFDDSAPLMSLYEKMTTDDALKASVEPWRIPMEQAMDRVETLQRGAAAIRALRRAFAKAAPTAEATVFSDVDLPQCRAAFQSLRETAEDALEYNIKLATVGRFKLAYFEKICTDSQNAELAAVHFPELAGPAPLKKLVRQLYTKEFKGHVVRKIAIPGGWEDSPTGSGRTLKVIVGVKKPKAFPEYPCAMEEILLEQEKKDGKAARPSCCQVEKVTAIDCGELD